MASRPAFPVRWLLLAAIIATLPYVYTTAFTAMPWHDDVGTLMITFRDLMDGRRLYDDEYALYGPFYYVSVGELFTAVHLPLTHDVVHFISAGFWLACASVLSCVAYRLTRSLVVAAFAFLTSLFQLAAFVDSPMHPEEISLLLLSTLPVLLARIERKPTLISLATVGVIVSAVTLTKVNFGVFIAAAIVLMAIRATRGAVWLGRAFVPLAIASLFLPLALMQPLLRLPWVVAYCAFATATIATALLVWWRADVPEIFTFRHWRICLIAAIATAAAIVASALIGGSTATAILNATIVQNRHFIQNWYIERHLSIAAAATTLAAFASAAAYVTLNARATTRLLAHRMVLWIKLALGFAMILLIVGEVVGGSVWVVWSALFQILVPFSWLLIVPPVPGPEGAPMTRGAIGLLAAFIVLYPFPVSGSGQMAIAVALPAAMLPVLLHDALTNLNLPSLYFRLDPPQWRRAGIVLSCLVLGTMLVAQTGVALNRYLADSPLDLPGARFLRVDPQTVDTTRWVVSNLSQCTSIYPLGGGASFLFWAQKPAATGMNTNDPLGLLTDRQQEQLVTDLKARPGLCIVRSPQALKMFDRGQAATQPALLRYIDANFAVATERQQFEVLKPKESSP